MGDVKNITIGTVDQFDGNEKVKDLAREAGNPNVLETIDIEKRFGSVVLTPESIKAFFLDDNEQLFQGSALENRIKFFKEYPKKSSIKGMWDKHPGDMAGFFDEYYKKVTEAHEKYGVPYLVVEAEYIIERIKALMTRDEKQFKGIFEWLCTKNNSLSDDMLTFIILNMLVSAAMTSSKLLRGELVNCEDNAGKRQEGIFKDAKVNMLMAYIKGNSEPLEVGKPISIQKVKEAIKGNGVTVLFYWATFCPACRMAMPMVNKLVERLKSAGGKVIGLVSEQEQDEGLAEARKEHSAKWEMDLKLSPSDGMKLPNSIPAFIILNKDGKILKILTGADQNLVEELQDLELL